MGCLLAKIFDPALPDISVRNYWHVSGVILDAAGCGVSQLKSRSRTGSASLEVSSAAGATNARASNGSISLAKIGAIQVLF
uniref:Uncharacterized protein n=1 Tax=Ditylenchus dipsaci TaxID=166011 RepID=A0A915DVD9_9BILA